MCRARPAVAHTTRPPASSRCGHSQRPAAASAAASSPARACSPRPRCLPPAQDHYNGKQYLGWKAIREKHTELTSKEGARLERGGSSREGERDRERERHSSRDRWVRR